MTVSSGPCSDVAGNTNSGISSASFKIDHTAPSAALSVTAGTLGDNGWYTSDVTVARQRVGLDLAPGHVHAWTSPRPTETTGHDVQRLLHQ